MWVGRGEENVIFFSFFTLFAMSHTWLSFPCTTNPQLRYTRSWTIVLDTVR